MDSTEEKRHKDYPTDYPRTCAFCGTVIMPGVGRTARAVETVSRYVDLDSEGVATNPSDSVTEYLHVLCAKARNRGRDVAPG